MSKTTAAVIAWRWLSGHTLDGRYRTNATWTMPSRGDQPVMHPTGHAVRWHHMPRLHRAGIRAGATAAFLAACYGLAAAFWLTAAVLTAAVLTAAAYGTWRLYRRILRWRHHRRWVRPLHRALTPVLGAPPSRLAIEPDRSKVIVGVPVEFTGSDKEREAITRAVTTKLAIEAPDASWKLHGKNPQVTFTQSEPPPARVSWDDLAAAVRAAAANELVFGLGKRAVLVKASYSDSPHVAIPGGSGGGKALALDTRVPTPDGWTTMGEITPGDVVYDETGAPARVIAATEVMHGRRCYEVQFSDGSVIVADAGHQWLTEDAAARKSFGRVKNPPPTCPARVMTTEVMAASLRARRTYKVDEANYSVKVAAPLQCPAADLPVPPYTLGAWLGDGATVTGSTTSADAEIISEIEAEGETIWVVPSTIKANHASYRVKGLNVRPRAAGVLGNKHIPVAYLRASEGQRRALLAGLLDTDGYCALDGQANFYSTRERLARDVYHLVATLGYKATLTSKIARVNGKDCGIVWTVTFTPGDKVFRLSRKVARQVVKIRSTAGRRYVTDIRAVPSVPVRCIEVDSPSHLYLVGDTCIPTHNSNLAAFLLLQEMMRGSLVINLDPKWISHLWMQDLPNVINAHDIPDLHLALCWLGGELLRRTKAAYYSAGGTGRVRGTVGDRIIVLCEELNYGMPGLKDYWRETRSKDDAKQSPAIAALSALSCAGRASEIHEWLIAQLLTVASTGVSDSTIRTNAGIKAMARWDPPGWAMAVGKHVTMPPQTTIPGRIHVVTGDGVRETQVPYLHLDDKDERVAEEAVRWARDLAVSGTVALIPSDIPRQLWPVSVLKRERLAIEAGQGGLSNMTSPDVPVSGTIVVTLAEAVDRGIIGPTIQAVRKARSREDGFPEPVGERPGTGRPALLYDASDLHEWGRNRREERTLR